MIQAIENPRLNQLQHWLQTLKIAGTLDALAGDASFRSYYRLHNKNSSYIIMNAPPDKENCRAFIKIATTLKNIGVLVPTIIAQNLQQGFLLLTDFGDQLLINQLTEKTAPDFYRIAFEILIKIQTEIGVNQSQSFISASYTQQEYQRELDLFLEWYVEGLQQKKLSLSDKKIFDNLCSLLIENCLAQPQVFVHRDFHSRNLMILENDDLGILDFQDALWGPITYDIISLVKDCYIHWHPEKVRHWILQYQQLALTAGIIAEDNSENFIKWCDFTGLQRHLKCVGIFARLKLRDNKPSYLQYLPRIMNYIFQVIENYSCFSEFKKLMEKII